MNTEPSNLNRRDFLSKSLAGAGAGLHHPDACVTGGQVAQRRHLICAGARALGDHRVDGADVGDDRPVWIAAGGRVDQAHLGAEHVGGGVERPAVTAARVVARSRQSDAGAREELVAETFLFDDDGEVRESVAAYR